MVSKIAILFFLTFPVFAGSDLESILCQPGWKLQKEVCYNPKTHETRFLTLTTNGHVCPSKYMTTIGNYCVPKKLDKK